MVWDNEWERKELERQEAVKQKMAFQETSNFNKKINSGLSSKRTIDLSSTIVVNPEQEQRNFHVKVLKWLKNRTTLIIK